MSLSANDFQQIRTIVSDEVNAVFDSKGRQIISDVNVIFDSKGRQIVRDEVSKELKPINEKLEKLDALENDVKDIYHMLARHQIT